MKKLLATLSLILSSQLVYAEQPKLIVQLTVDQLRGELLHRYQDHFVNQRNRKGFNRFLEQGITYDNTHYRHASTLTAVGHATLATGAVPSQHGIIANDWYDASHNQHMYCVADANSTLLGDEGKSASPANLMASTFSDQLHLGTNGKAKIYSVSIKDRGAVLTGGHFGKSFWYNKSTGNFVTSDYYYKELPEWVTEFNESGLKDSYLGKEWKLSKDEDKYHNGTKNRIFQIPPKGFQRGFPHSIAKVTSKDYYRMLSFTPYGDEMTMEFAKKLIELHQLGEDNVTDYLSISFSVNDYIGHTFGPNSLEAEDNLIKLDSLLAEFFYYLDKRIGLDNVLLVISADHGVDAIPEYKKSIGFAGFRGAIPDAVQKIDAQLKEQYKTEASLVRAIELPNVYLNHEAIKAAKLDAETIRKAFSTELMKIPGVAKALTRTEISAIKASQDPVISKVINNFVDSRSGDITIVQNTSTMVDNYSAATHGSPYRYDTHVPMYFAGWNLKPQRITRLTSPEDIAVTLSAVMNIGYPDRATGNVLEEVAK